MSKRSLHKIASEPKKPSESEFTGFGKAKTVFCRFCHANINTQAVASKLLANGFTNWLNEE